MTSTVNITESESSLRFVANDAVRRGTVGISHDRAVLRFCGYIRRPKRAARKSGAQEKHSNQRQLVLRLLRSQGSSTGLLSGNQRLKLYLRQTYTTWGIYIKSTLFPLRDQRHDTYPEWGDGFAGFGKRLGTRQAQFIIQNSVTSLGDGLLGWEPRYDRCRCDGFWPRTRVRDTPSLEISSHTTARKNPCGPRSSLT
jgi:hypothetical protein